MKQGFDSYFGVPYSNDMDQTGGTLSADERFGRIMDAKIEYFNVPLMRNDAVIERPAQQTTLTKRYTDEGIAFIKAHRSQPFFLYLAHNFPHMPLFRSTEFEGKSQRGLYGDAVEEIDFNVGRLLSTLRQLNLEQNTVVLYMSDNGPWAPYLEQGGSAGLLRGAKGSTWEGGVRVPAIFWAPGLIKSGVTTGIGSELGYPPDVRESVWGSGAVRPCARRIRPVSGAEGNGTESSSHALLLCELRERRAECSAPRCVQGVLRRSRPCRWCRRAGSSAATLRSRSGSV